MLLGLALGFFNSLQFSSMNSMAYADIDAADSSMATLDRQHAAADVAELRPGVRLARLPAGIWATCRRPTSVAVTTALHHTFLTVGGADACCRRSSFWTLRPGDGDNVSRGKMAT